MCLGLYPAQIYIYIYNIYIYIYIYTGCPKKSGTLLKTFHFQLSTTFGRKFRVPINYYGLFSAKICCNLQWCTF